jgi:hypothetical protein
MPKHAHEDVGMPPTHGRRFITPNDLVLETEDGHHLDGKPRGEGGRSDGGAGSDGGRLSADFADSRGFEELTL